MNITLWVIQIVLAVVFLAAGVTKEISSNDKIRTTYFGAEPWLVRLLGIAEILGAIGLIVPEIAGIVPALTPLAAFGLALIMLGLLVLRIRRKEYKSVAGPTLFFALAAFVAWARFGPFPS